MVTVDDRLSVEELGEDCLGVITVPDGWLVVILGASVVSGVCVEGVD